MVERAWTFFLLMRYMKKILFVLIVSFYFIGLQAQTMFSPDGGMDHYEKTERTVYDTAKINVYYTLYFLADSSKTDNYTKGLMVLQVSDHYLRFGDLYRIQLDSINDFCAINKKNAKKAANDFNQTSSKVCYGFNITSLADLDNETATVQLQALREYQYTVPLPKFDWQLTKGDSIINGLACKRAVCRYAGRSYIAWFAPSINLPYGPYLFGGLPGLIMCLCDKSNNWIFTNSGIEVARSNRDMYLYGDKDIIKTDREKALSAYKNEIEDWNNLAVDIIGLRVIKNGKEIKPDTNYPRKPSNMLELK